MGLTNSSTGFFAPGVSALEVREGERLIALSGSPNVGKSTLFNRLTGLKQHTGNWSGKTVGCAFGRASHNDSNFVFADIPGTYSLCASSAEEELARDFICFGGAERTCVVCDAGCLSRGLMLALQVLEAHRSVVICVNLLDEAKKLGIEPDIEKLSHELGVPVVGLTASRGEGVHELLELLSTPAQDADCPPLLYSEDIEAAIEAVCASLGSAVSDSCSRFVAISLLRADEGARNSISEQLGIPPAKLLRAAEIGRECLTEPDSIDDTIAAELSRRAHELEALVSEPGKARKRGVDRILTHPVLGLPAMGALLALTLWLTIKGANVPSEMLSKFLFSLGTQLEGMCGFLPAWMRSAIFDGMWRTAAWVTAVMLPPMAIFFPLFTLLEDIGYLPRVAFNLDGFFQRAHGSGKQGLTM